ncbi:MAG: glycosyltransferase family 4 protein [Eubacteriales bacterium]|nr:glycosyltransferase family 4 protein [Eubacteriales bacterium]
MKILWVVSSLLPQIARCTGEREQPFGGWLVSVLDRLLTDDTNEITVCYRASGIPKEGTDGRLSYRSFPQGVLTYSPENEADFAALLRENQPDVIHIWGTEYPSALAMVNACEREGLLDRLVVSIQGLTSVYALYYEAGLPKRVVRSYTLRDLLRGDNIAQQQKKFVRRGAFETEALEKAKHGIGRTSWDLDCTRRINPGLIYHHCDETLRSAFYEGAWDVASCRKYTIFVSQGDYPIKGFHQALEALAIIRREYPEARLITTGSDPRAKGLRARLHRSSYTRYLASTIRRLDLKDNVTFLGSLPAEGMKEQYLNAHVALNPSSIENSSNAIGEAMLLGVPVVASRVGGSPDMVGEEGGILYPFERPDQLSEAVCRIFSSDELAKSLSDHARKMAKLRHDPVKNMRDLTAIYRSLAGVATENH